MWNLQGLNILIAERDLLLADDLANYVSQSGTNVLGPSSTLAQAATYLSRADVAILDVSLNGHPIFPLADDLISLGVPIVFYTGFDDVDLPLRFLHLNCLRKPASRQKLIGALLGCDLRYPDATKRGQQQGSWHPNARSVPRHETSPAEIMLHLPKLRLVARVITGNGEKGDHLVAQTLERAIAEAARKPREVPLLDWLDRIMDDCHDLRMYPGSDRWDLRFGERFSPPAGP